MRPVVTIITKFLFIIFFIYSKEIWLTHYKYMSHCSPTVVHKYMYMYTYRHICLPTYNIPGFLISIFQNFHICVFLEFLCVQNNRNPESLKIHIATNLEILNSETKKVTLFVCICFRKNCKLLKQSTLNLINVLCLSNLQFFLTKFWNYVCM